MIRSRPTREVWSRPVRFLLPSTEPLAVVFASWDRGGGVLYVEFNHPLALSSEGAGNVVVNDPSDGKVWTMAPGTIFSSNAMTFEAVESDPTVLGADTWDFSQTHEITDTTGHTLDAGIYDWTEA